MKVAELLEARRQNWRELDEMCSQMGWRRKKSLGARKVARFAALYRSVCADLALADTYQLPPNTVQYLHQLVGRAHNQVYRTRSFQASLWLERIFVDAPQRLFREKFVWISFMLFWSFFLGTMFLAGSADSPYPNFAEELCGTEQLRAMKQMYAEPISNDDPNQRSAMLGFYIYHNAGIGLQCFAYGLLIVPGLYVTISNATQLGTVFGYMFTQPQWENFSHFVTAHGPFELTAIVMASAAGLKLGWSLISTGGLRRIDSLRRAGQESMPIVGVFVALFCGAALIEGFLSPSSAPYWAKALVAVVSSGILMFYFGVLGYPRGEAVAT